MGKSKIEPERRVRIPFWRDEGGGITVEFVMWLPLILAVIAFIADASMAFGARSTIMRDIQDTNRAVSIGKITDLKAAEKQLSDQITPFAPNATVATTVDKGVITTVVTVPIGDITTMGLISKIRNFNLTIASQHLSEG